MVFLVRMSIADTIYWDLASISDAAFTSSPETSTLSGLNLLSVLEIFFMNDRIIDPDPHIGSIIDNDPVAKPFINASCRVSLANRSESH